MIADRMRRSVFFRLGLNHVFLVSANFVPLLSTTFCGVTLNNMQTMTLTAILAEIAIRTRIPWLAGTLLSVHFTYHSGGYDLLPLILQPVNHPKEHKRHSNHRKLPNKKNIFKIMTSFSLVNHSLWGVLNEGHGKRCRRRMEEGISIPCKPPMLTLNPASRPGFSRPGTEVQRGVTVWSWVRLWYGSVWGALIPETTSETSGHSY